MSATGVVVGGGVFFLFTKGEEKEDMAVNGFFLFLCRGVRR